MKGLPVNRYQLSAYVAAVGVFVGTTTAPVIGPVHPDVTLLSADGPLSGSDTAIILGPSYTPEPSDSYAQAAENLYLNPLGFDGGATDSAVCDMSGQDPCGATLQVLTTPENFLANQSFLTGATEITQAVQNEFADNPGVFSAEHPLTVFAYSQSATDASIAMTELAKDGVPLDAVHFVFIGNGSDAAGVFTNMYPDLSAVVGPTLAQAFLTLADAQDVEVGTPTDLYPVTNYTLDGDGVGDWQPDYSSGGLPAAISGVLNQHLEYLGLTPQQIADATTTTDGNLTQVDISDSGVNELTAMQNVEQAFGWFNYMTWVNEVEGNAAGIAAMFSGADPALFSL